MDNQELMQVVELFKQQNDVMAEMFADLKREMQSEIQTVKNDIKQVRLEQETNVAKRIEALFDGYKLTHEKQWEQERKIEALQAQMESMHIRLATLENRSA